MNQSDWSGFPFPACPAEARVALLLAKYAVFGVVPLIIPSVLIDVPLPIDQIPSQQGTDLEYIKALADNVGYVFYLDPGPAPGMSKAYWGPQIKVGPVQPAIRRPYLIWLGDRQIAQEIRINLVPRRRLRGVRLAIDRFDRHALHQRRDVQTSSLDAFEGEQIAEHPAARERIIQVREHRDCYPDR